MEEDYKKFINIVPDNLKEFVNGINDYLIKSNFKRTIKPSAKAFLVSYTVNNKALLNFVFRKGFIKARIYANHISEYQEVLNNFPEITKNEIANSLDCRKLNGKTCSPTCPTGYTFIMDGKECKKCRSMAFLITLNNDNNPIIKKMIELEVIKSN